MASFLRWGGVGDKERRIRLNGFRTEGSNSSVSLIAQLLCYVVSFLFGLALLGHSGI